jgi:hypothetical protein
MGLLIVTAFLLAIGPLALLYGVDSRNWDDRDRRGWWPGERRSR